MKYIDYAKQYEGMSVGQLFTKWVKDVWKEDLKDKELYHLKDDMASWEIINNEHYAYLHHLT